MEDTRSVKACSTTTYQDLPVSTDPGNTKVEPTTVETEEPYTVYTQNQKQLIIILVSIAASFSPFASNVLYGAITSIADNLHVSISEANLSFTSYQIAQGLAPMFVAEFTESAGRRPTYLLCLVVFLAANIGLALQRGLAALIVLRVVQAAGSSALGVLANAVIADIATTAERGSFMGYTYAGAFIGQSIGPAVGGLLTHFLGWSSTFWFLAIFAGVFFVPIALFLPETARKLVGNGTRKPSGTNRNLLDLLHRDSTQQAQMLPRPALSFPNPYTVLLTFRSIEATIILLYAGLVFAGLAVIGVAIPDEFHTRYGYNNLQIGLSFIPTGAGSCLAAVVSGRLADWNYRRHRLKRGLPVDQGRLLDPEKFPIEKARVEVALPLAIIAGVSAIAYGWTLQYSSSVAGPLISLFLIGFASAGAFNVMSTLLLDVQVHSAARASACNNLVRCVLGAGASAVAVPINRAIKPGWSYTAVGLLWLALQPLALLSSHMGPHGDKGRCGIVKREMSDDIFSAMMDDLLADS